MRPKKKTKISKTKKEFKEILPYDHAECPCFDYDNLIKHNKYELLVPYESLPDNQDYKFDNQDYKL